jgi:hypothetical protein
MTYMSQCPIFRKYIRSLPKAERDERKRKLNYIRNHGKKSGLGGLYMLNRYTYEEVLKLEEDNLKFYGKKIVHCNDKFNYD